MQRARPVLNPSTSLPGSPEMMNSQDAWIRNGSLLFSLLVHAALFVQFTSMQVSSQAQAPEKDTRISLNLLSPQKPQQEAQEIPEPPKPKPERQHAAKPTKIQQVQPEQAVAPKQAKEVQRQDADPVAERERFLARLLTHIEGYKYYPRTARQRGIEGSIRVTFRLLPDGNIRDLTTDGGPLILRSAAKGAVNKAVPLPACPPEVDCPMVVSYAMQFQLR